MYRKNLNKRQGSLINGDYKLYALIFIGLTIVVFNTIRSISLGSKLSMLEEEESMLISENKELSSMLVENSSLTKIEEKSLLDGFVKPSKIVYINENIDAVANLR